MNIHGKEIDAGYVLLGCAILLAVITVTYMKVYSQDVPTTYCAGACAEANGTYLNHTAGVFGSEGVAAACYCDFADGTTRNVYNITGQ